MDNELTAILVHELVSLPSFPRFCVRADDISLVDRSVETFVRAATISGIPISLGVIPAKLTPASAEWISNLCQLPHAHLEVHQHGWEHRNHETEARKSEFGPGRSLESQREDLCCGRQRLLDFLGDLAVPIFCPPWNRMAAETADLLADLGFRGVSSFGCLTNLPRTLTDVSANMDWEAVMRCGPCAAATGVMALLDHAHAGRPINVMIHPVGQEENHWRGLIEMLEIAAACGSTPTLLADMLEDC